MVLGGDPGRVPSDVTLDNWQSAAQLHWTFQHIADFLPTAVISRGAGPGRRAAAAHPVELSDIPLFDRTNGRRTTVGDVMAATATDGWIVTQHGKVLERALLRRHARRHLAPADVGEQVADRAWWSARWSATAR